MDFGQFRRLIRRTGLDTTSPRVVGCPMQKLCMTDEQMFQMISNWMVEGRTCFAGSNAYSNFAFEPGGKISPTTIVYANTFLDFDHETKPENSFADAAQCSAFLRENDIAHWVSFSGSKGYHIHIIHEAKRFKFNHQDGSAAALKAMCYGLQNHLKLTLGLPTMDEASMGDPKKLCRIPYTPHVNRSGKKNGRTCYLLPNDEQLQSMNHDDIVEGSYNPEFKLYRIVGDRLSLPETVERLGIILSKPEEQIQPIIGSSIGVDPRGNAQRFLSSLDLRCPGVTNELKRLNPKHKARVYSALFAKVMSGMSAEQFESVWVEMGNSVGYVDLHNTEHRQYQMSTLFGDPRMAHFPNCTTLKANGCCIGEACPKYKQVFDAPPPTRRIRRKWRKEGDLP